tara:strand:+ start:379 stop:1029 length:651 start_codon:yes stop_codon:yes gene_type:complete
MSSNLKYRLYTSLFLFLLIYLIFKFNFFLVYSLIVLGVFAAIEFFNISKKIFVNKLIRILLNIFFILFIFIFCNLFFILNNVVQFKILLISLLFGCIASDVGGYVIGKTFKGPKLTKISPNKTISGSVGSFFVTYVTLSSIYYYFLNYHSYKILLISFFITLGCQLGDLFFSLLKRKAKIKDTGNIFPGHGGVLDRLDSIFFGLPIGFISLIIFLK